MICATAYLERRQNQHPAPGEAQLLKDVLWAHAKPEFGLQHIRAKAEDDGVLLHLFFQGTDTARASDHTQALVHSARSSQLLMAYHWTPQPYSAPLG